MAIDDELHMFANEAAASEHCPDDLILWMDAETGASYQKGSDQFGRGKGGYFCSKEARAARRRGRERVVYHFVGPPITSTFGATAYRRQRAARARARDTFRKSLLANMALASVAAIGMLALFSLVTRCQPTSRTNMYAGYWMSPKPYKFDKNYVAPTDTPATNPPEAADDSTNSTADDTTPNTSTPRKAIARNYGMEKLTLYAGDRVNIRGFHEYPDNPEDAKNKALHFGFTWLYQGAKAALESDESNELESKEHCSVSPQQLSGDDPFQGLGVPVETSSIRVNCGDAHYIAVQVMQDLGL